MGLSNFPSTAEGVLPVLVMNTIFSVALLKNMLRSVLQVMGATGGSPNFQEDSDEYPRERARERRVSITQFKSLLDSRYDTGSASVSCGGVGGSGGECVSSSSSRSACATIVECCVCLSGFEADEEVSELSCKHFFHRGCLDKWFDNKNTTCPLCRSIH